MSESVLGHSVLQNVQLLQRRPRHRQLVRYGLLGFNALLLGSVFMFVLAGQNTSGDSPLSAQSAILSSGQTNSVANPLDQVSSADIAYNVASMSALPEATSVGNQAASVNLELSAPPTTASIVSKPQVVSTALKSKKDIKTYVVAAGDTVASIAAKFNVTSDSVKWSNSLASNTVAPGQTLSIPPEGISGIVYTVKAGDTPDSLAARYKANKDEITAYNDAELTPLKVGEKIIIPGGSVAAPTPVAAASSSSGGLAWGSSPIYGSNAYAYGYCTWYVANRIAVPSNWGNANTWDNGAAISGWHVSSVPTPGAIGQTDRGAEGHVAVVEAVSADGTQIKYSDMNGLAGWGREGHSWTIGPWVASGGWAPVNKFEHYITQ
jgi:surface antigen